MSSVIKKVLTITGSDCTGGAGIQADIKTITAHKMYAMSAITALTAQIATGVLSVFEVTPEFIGRQLDCIFTNLRPDAVKIGMVDSAEIIEVIAEKLKAYKTANIVIDPMMAASTGGKLLIEGTAAALISKLFPLATVITPNIPEAEALSGIDILSGRNSFTQQNMIRAAQLISEKVSCAILIKGGHLECTADDLLYIDGSAHWFPAERIDSPNTHGAGSTLSSAIACKLAGGQPLPDSVRYAKDYTTAALKSGLKLGTGAGLLDHMWKFTIE